MEVNKKRLSEIFGVSVRTIQNWQDQGMPVARGGGKGNEVLYESSAAIEWYSARDAAIENEKLRKEVEDLRLASETRYSSIRTTLSDRFSGSVIAPAGVFWALERKRPGRSPVKLRRPGKNLRRMIAAALMRNVSVHSP